MIKFLTIAMLVLVSCSRQPSKQTAQELSRQWMLTSMADFPRDTLVKYRSQIDLSDLKSPVASFDCNRIGFVLKFRNNQRIIFTKLLQKKNVLYHYAVGVGKCFCENGFANR